MKIRKLSMGIAGVLLGIGVSGQAAAYTYAGASIDVQNLTVLVTEDGTTPTADATINNFQFVLNGTSVLSPAPSSPNQSTTCTGVASGGSFITSPDCNTGIGVTPRVDMPVANDPDNTIVIPEDNFSAVGPNGSGSYSTADAEITAAQLLGDTSSATKLIAQTERDDTGDGNADASITSTTGFTFSFSVTAANQQLILAFEADPELLAESENPGSIAVIAGADLNLTASLTRESDGTTISWTPDGDVTAGACTGLEFGICDETDSQSLDESVSINADGSSAPYSSDNIFTAFGITFYNLGVGDYSFVLEESVQTNVFKVEAVPEPSTLLLLGAGLAGLGGVRRGMKRRTV